MINVEQVGRLSRKYLPSAVVNTLAEFRRARLIDEWMRAVEATRELDSVSVRTLIPDLLSACSNPGWAASLEYLTAIADHAHSEQQEPRLVLECGTGASTFLLHALSRANSNLSVMSLEHDPKWFEKLDRILGRHRSNVHVVNAPLREYERGEWFDVEIFESTIDKPIDLVVCDGPPRDHGNRALLVPLIGKHLAEDCTILLDDIDRVSEREALLCWYRELGAMHRVVEGSKPYAIVKHGRARH